MTRSCRFAVAVLTIAVAPVSAYAAASISNPSFIQASWYTTSGVLDTANSSFGRFDFDAVADPTTTHYLNLVGTSGTNSSWFVRNFPLFDASTTPGTVRFCADLDFAELGIAPGAAVTSLQYRVSVTASPLDTAPAGADIATAVDEARYTLRREDGTGLEGKPVRPAPHQAGGEATRVIEHKGVPRVMEDSSQCMPGAFARSIGWLNQTYNLGVSMSAQELYGKLVTEIGIGLGQSREDRIQKKAGFLRGITDRGVTKVRDLTDLVGPITGVGEDSTTNLIDWLNTELKTEDVELAVRYADGGRHIVTLVGIFQQDGAWHLRYRDDALQVGQDPSTAGDRGIKTARLGSASDGFWFGESATAVTYCVSESVPEPGFGVVVMGVSVALTRRRRGAPGS